MIEHNNRKTFSRPTSAKKCISILTSNPRSSVHRDRKKSRFSLGVRLRDTGEIFTVTDCHGNMRIKELKIALELEVGLPTDFQRICYLDQGDLLEESTLRYNDIVPGTAVTVAVWPYDGWAELVTAAASGDVCKLRRVVSKPAPQRSSASSWLSHRLFSALFVAAHRGHAAAVRFLLQHVDYHLLYKPVGCPPPPGADVGGQTPQGRGALHAAAARGRDQVIQDLLLSGVPLHLEDSKGMTALGVAEGRGQRKTTRQLFLFHWQERAAGVRIKPHLEEKELFAHQRHDSHLKTWRQGGHAQRYMAYQGGEGRGGAGDGKWEGRKEERMSRLEGKAEARGGSRGDRGEGRWDSVEVTSLGPPRSSARRAWM